MEGGGWGRRRMGGARRERRDGAKERGIGGI